MSTFITSDFSGSTTEPVKRKISVHVVSARIASAHGRCAPSEACWSTNPAVWPVTRASGSSARTVLTSCCVRSASPSSRGSRSSRHSPAAISLAGSTRGDPRRRREARRDVGGRRCVHDRRDRRVAPSDAFPVERLGDLARARRRGQRRRVDPDEVDTERREREDDEERGGDRRDPPRSAHHPGRKTAPAAARGHLLQPAGSERVDPRAEPVEERRQRDERDETGGEGDEDAAEAHRVEELLREDEQAAHRGGDRDGAEEDGAPRTSHRRGERLRAVSVHRRFLPPARDDEQRVVDREAEAEAGDEIEREDREGVHLDRDPEPEERERDRTGTDEGRQECRHEAAEDPEREQEDEREGDQLCAARGPPGSPRSPGARRSRRRRGEPARHRRRPR